MNPSNPVEPLTGGRRDVTLTECRAGEAFRTPCFLLSVFTALTPVGSCSLTNLTMIVVITTFNHHYSNLWTRRCTFLEVKVHSSPPFPPLCPQSTLCSRCEIPEGLSSWHTHLWPLKRGRSNLDHWWHPGDWPHTHTGSQVWTLNCELWREVSRVSGIPVIYEQNCQYPAQQADAPPYKEPPLNACTIVLRTGLNIK